MTNESNPMKPQPCTLKELTEEEKLKLQREARERYYADREADINGGIQTGRNLTLRLYTILKEQNRLDDLDRCVTDNAFYQSLMKEFNLT